MRTETKEKDSVVRITIHAGETDLHFIIKIADAFFLLLVKNYGRKNVDVCTLNLNTHAIHKNGSSNKAELKSK